MVPFRRRFNIWRAFTRFYLCQLGAVTGLLFGLLFTSLWNKEIDYDTDVIKVMLTTVTYVPAQDTDDYKDDVSNEISGTGYTATGETLLSKTVTYTAGTNKHKLDAADLSWTTATFTARIAVIYDSTPATDATRPLIGYQDFGQDESVTAGTFTIQWHADGIIEITVS